MRDVAERTKALRGLDPRRLVLGCRNWRELAQSGDGIVVPGRSASDVAA